MFTFPVIFANLVSTLDHPRQHRHDPHQKLLAFARGTPVEDSAPLENVHSSSIRILVYVNVYRSAVNVYGLPADSPTSTLETERGQNTERPTPNAD